MPFRFRIKNRCLTTEPTKSNAVKFEPCINLLRRRYMEVYAMEQLFYYYPLINEPQKVRQVTTEPDLMLKCLTVMSNSNELSYKQKGKYQLEMIPCDSHSNLHTQLFTIEKRTTAKVDHLRVNSVKSNIKPLSLITIIWNSELDSKHPSNEKYCVFFNHSIEAIILKLCPDSKRNHNFYSQYSNVSRGFVSERTVSVINPYRSGVQIGTYPE